MARKKQRENYGKGSVTPVEIKKLDSNGLVVFDESGKPVTVQRRDSQGRPIWRVCITLGKEEYADKHGNIRKRQRKVQKLVHGTLDDARRIAEQMTKQHENIDLKASRNTFEDACSRWADSMRDNQTCAPSKLKDYMTRLSYVSARLGAKPLLEITTDDLEQALSAVKAEHHQSQRTYRETKRHVKRVFQFALAKHWIVFDPSADLAKVSVKGRVERRSLEASEFARLCACVDRDLASEIEAFEQKELRQMAWGNGFTRSSIKGLASISCLIGVRILCATGCRRGEVLALTWEKVNFHSNEITIDKALNSDGVIKDPKTEAGIRTLSIDPETMSLLKRWKAFQKNALHLVMAKDPTGKKHPVGQNEQTPVVCGCTGSFLDPHNMNRWWGGNAKTAGYRDRAGFPDLKLHELRHTVATLLLGSGMPVIDVATRLGHDDVSVTLNTYGHAIPAHDQKAADLLGSFMSASTAISPHVAEAVRRSA